ncbi:hypothetical protein WUBG_05879, partial [Wuchereria bancrofti]
FAPYYQPEYCLAYAVYILAKLPSFESIKCEPELRRLTESIWFLLGIFNARKEPGSLEFIYNIFQTVKNSTDSKLQSCSREELQQKNEKIWALCDIGMLLMSYRVKILVKDIEVKPLLSKRFFLNMGKANTKVYVPASFVKEMKTNTKHQKTDKTKATTKSLVRHSLTNNSKQSTKVSSVLKVGSKRAVNKKQSNRNRKAQVNDFSVSNEIDEIVVKHPKLVSEEEKLQQASSPLKMLMGEREEMEIPTTLKSLNDENKPGTSEANPSNKDDHIRGSLEDCDYSPIRPVHVKTATTRQPLFTSSTPIVATKRRRTIVTGSENNDVVHKDQNDTKVVTTKKLRKVGKRNGDKCGNTKKLSSAQSLKRLGEKARTEIVPDTSSIATRLRSRQAVISFPAQRPDVESNK